MTQSKGTNTFSTKSLAVSIKATIKHYDAAEMRLDALKQSAYQRRQR